MRGLNKFQAIGRLGQDPNVTVFDDGGRKAVFTIATTDARKNEKGEWVEFTDWVNCYATGKLAEVVEKHFKQGIRVYIEGKFKSRNYEGKNGTVYVSEIKVNDFMFLGSKKE